MFYNGDFHATGYRDEMCEKNSTHSKNIWSKNTTRFLNKSSDKIYWSQGRSFSTSK